MARSKLFLPLFAAIALVGLKEVLSAGTGICSETEECVSGCCSDTGFCGFGPDYCGDSCISTCNRTAECGEYAETSGAACPLNVCCSEFGFCGTTSEFCGDGCQSGCDEPEAPTCSTKTKSATKKRIGYYESWTMNRSCNVWEPNKIDATKWTHLNYAFALIDESTYKIAQMNTFDVSLYGQFTNLKVNSPSLEVYISVGGWDAGGEIWSKMTSTKANRAAFIQSTIKFMKTYAFDGVDIDWEYPVAEDRGGDDADFENFVTFLKELREATGDDYGITVTLPSSYWYLQGFDIVNMEQYVDWFNIMSYDIHGTWDGKNEYTSSVVQAHTNLTEIDDALNLLWRNDISSSKVVLGLGFYGRSFTLSDPDCTKPGCPFSGGAEAGECTDTSGVLSLQEIKEIIEDNDLDPVLDEDAAVKYITWNDDQWVSYDDTETFAMKLKYANSKCLAGTMVWALDLDTVVVDSAIDSLLESDSGLSVKMRTTISYENTFSLGIFWTACLPPTADEICPDGYYAMLWGHGKVFDADLNHITGMGCHGGGVNGYQRALCVENNIKAGCQWGTGVNSKACNSKCHDGFITLTKNSHVAGQKKGCKSGKYAPVCCEYIKATSKSSSDTCYNDYANGVFGGGLSQKLSLGSSQSYTYTSDDEDSLEVRDHNALKARQLQKRSNAAEKKKRSVDTDGGCGYVMARDEIALQIPGYLEVTKIAGTVSYRVTPTSVPSTTSSSKKPTITIHDSTRVTEEERETRTCNGELYPQACVHYSSVAREYDGDSRYQHPTCADTDVKRELRPIPLTYSKQHHESWTSFIAESYINPNGKRKAVACQRDEWPPSHFMQGVEVGYIRLLPGGQNGGAANRKDGGWRNFCKYPPDSTVVVQGGPVVDMGIYYEVTEMTSTIVTLRVMEYSYKSIDTPAGDKDAMKANPCWPSVLTNDPGFALLTWDSWYSSNAGHTPGDYGKEPAYAVTVGKSQPQYKRAVDSDTGELVYVVDEGNSTRRATDEELAEHFGLQKCNTPDCAEELKEWQSFQAENGLPTFSPGSESTPAPITTPAELFSVGTPSAEPVQATETSQATPTPAAVKHDSSDGEESGGEESGRRAHIERHLHGHRHNK